MCLQQKLITARKINVCTAEIDHCHGARYMCLQQILITAMGHIKFVYSRQ